MTNYLPPMLIVPEDHPGQRLDNFLFTALKHIPKSRLYKAIRSGEVRVNKGRAKPFHKLVAGDVVRVPPPFRETSADATPVSQHVAQSIEAHVAYEDQSLMVLHKPEGLAVHGGSGLRSGVIERLRQARPNHPYFELAHRIDRLTSGCLLIAKKRSVLRQLHECFAKAQVRKTYLAVVQGHWPKDLQKIDAPLSRDRLQSGEREAFVDEDSGKASVTLFRVIKYSKKNTLLQVRPKTGRMHQIRVHCQHAGYPIINDPKYNAWRTEGRMGLHAETLQFKLLSEDTPYQFQVAPDAAFTALLGDEQPENSHE